VFRTKGQLGLEAVQKKRKLPLSFGIFAKYQ